MVLSVIVRLSVTAVPETKKTRKFRETALTAHKERHHVEVSDDLQSIVDPQAAVSRRVESFIQAEKPPEFLRLAEKPPRLFFTASRRKISARKCTQL